jgi:F420-0:gamma-glutamyl ligase
VVRYRLGVLIVEHRLGFIMANAGVDRSNVDPDIGAEPVLLLPIDPDASAADLLDRLAAHFRKRLAVIIWRDATPTCSTPMCPGLVRRTAAVIASGCSVAADRPDQGDVTGPSSSTLSRNASHRLIKRPWRL